MTEDNAINALINNENKIREDLDKVKKYVKDDLFYRVIDVFDDNQLEVDSYLYKDFMKRCKSIVTGVGGAGEGGGTMQAYMKYLWLQLGKNRSYSKWLSTKRSNCYQSVQDKFFSKYLDQGGTQSECSPVLLSNASFIVC